ncbi:MAG: flavodoxin domain-containing protein [Dysgonamonadaceae bacterium]|nr:flavodoxin domain-containing protein [Dysgonamonadaceae bacterium]
MNGIILYKSKYGATKKYAEWLSEETGFEMLETSKAKISDVQKYDIIVLGGGIYASGIAGLDFLRKNIELLCDKKIIVFCVGASPYEEKAFNEIRNHNMKDKLSSIPCYYCRGGWDMDAMTFVDRNLCKMLRKAVAKKNPSECEVWEMALMAAGDEKCDWTDRVYLEPIIEEIDRQM